MRPSCPHDRLRWHPMPSFPPRARAARRRHARRRGRERALRLGRRRRSRRPRCCTPPATRTSLTFTRSALKPLQALPFVAGGGVERFGFSRAQVALLCASHSGEPRHVDAVADMLARAGNSAARPAVRHARAGLSTRCAARCRRRRRIRRSRTTARASTAACSLTASQCGCRRDDYLAFDHPLQQAIRARGRALHRRRRGESRRRHRRLLGAQLRGAAGARSRSRSRGSPAAEDDAGYGTRAAARWRTR